MHTLQNTHGSHFVTIRDMLELGKRLEMTLTRKVVKRAAPQDRTKQFEL